MKNYTFKKNVKRSLTITHPDSSYIECNNGVEYDPYLQAMKYYYHGSLGVNIVVFNYKKPDNSGRLFANNGISLINMKRIFRHTISHKYYYDIDMVNAHAEHSSASFSKSSTKLTIVMQNIVLHL